jgi:secondary thiamine-phosphate synthase enzyme
MINITQKIAERVPKDFDGVCYLTCLHTTAGLTINENADPDVVTDMLAELDRIVPWNNPAFKHTEGNSAAHVKASLTGASLAIPVNHGELVLGVWQAVYFCEFDGPRNRRVAVQFISA